MSARCTRCRQPLDSARVCVHGQWWCGDCASRHEHPDAPLVEPAPSSAPPSPPRQLQLPGAGGHYFDPANGDIPF